MSETTATINQDLKVNLKNNKTVLLLFDGKSYTTKGLQILKTLAKDSSVCYVTLNKTYKDLYSHFKAGGVDMENIAFIDAISLSLKSSVSQQGQCYYVSSPGALTELLLIISKFLEHKFDYIVIDAINNLYIYQDKNPVNKFILKLINKARENHSKTLFYAVGTAKDDNLLNEMTLFVDKVAQYQD